MELRDLIVTPLLLIIILIVAYFVRPYATDSINRKYFFPALILKLVGSIALGFIYQFYYTGGDTFNYHTHGSRHIWEAFMESSSLGVSLFFSNGDYTQGVYAYASKIAFFQDPPSFFVVRVAFLFDLITFSSYSATAALFGVISFIGGWLLFLSFYYRTPFMHKWLAAATLFIPSVLFWGSGLLKDTLTFSAVGLLTYTTSYFFFKKQFSIVQLFLMILAIWILFSVKKYILLCYLPAVLLWIYLDKLARIESRPLKIILTPVIFILLITSSYYAISVVGEGDTRYSVEKLAITAKVTAYDIGFYSGRGAGSGYSLGELDGTFASLTNKVPAAINVSLFRPYLWEVQNPLMLLSALESFALTILTLYVLFRKRLLFFKALTDPTIVFCLVFSLTFAFAVGVSTFNFGTLTRYKIPLLPFFVLALGYILKYPYQSENDSSHKL